MYCLVYRHQCFVFFCFLFFFCLFDGVPSSSILRTVRSILQSGLSRYLLCIDINDFFFWSIRRSSFLVHFKNGIEYLSKWTAYVSLVYSHQWLFWSIWRSSFLIHFKNGPEYLTKWTVQVFISLMKFLLLILVSWSVVDLLRYSFLIFSFVSVVWSCPVPVFLGTYNSWFRGLFLFLLSSHISHYHHHHHHVVPPARISLTLSCHFSLSFIGTQGYIPYPHIAGVCMFELVILLLLGHMRGSKGKHHLWARPLAIWGGP